MNPCKIKNKLHISKIQHHSVNISILKGRSRRITKKDCMKTKTKPSKANTKSYSSMSGTWHMSSNRLEHPCLYGHAICSPNGLSLGLAHSLPEAFLGRCSTFLTLPLSRGFYEVRIHPHSSHSATSWLYAGTLTLSHITWPPRPSFDICVEASMIP